MNQELNARFEEVIAEKIEELSEISINDQMHSAAAEDLKKLIDASVAFDKADAEYTMKDDQRVIEKERLELERMRLESEKCNQAFNQLLAEKQLKHQKAKDVVDSVLRGLGYVGTGLAFVLTLGFEEQNSVSSLAGRQAVTGVLRNIGKK